MSSKPLAGFGRAQDDWAAAADGAGVALLPVRLNTGVAAVIVTTAGAAAHA